MIELYSPGRDPDNGKNGDAVLFPLSCTIRAELNGTWQLSLEHPIDSGGIWAMIEDGAVLKAPSWQGDQLWRIFSRTRSEGGVSATAYPIFLDAANDVFLQDVRPTNTNGAGALQTIFNNTRYGVHSDITRTATAYYIRQNAIEAIAGTADNTFLKRWGGEIIYDNYDITINEQAGRDNGFVIRTGLNQLVDGIRETIDWSEVVTRVVPVAYNGYTLTGSTPWVNSPSINLYPVVRTKVWQFDDIRLASEVSDTEDTTGMYLATDLTDLRNALRTRAAALFSDEYIDQPKITVDVDMIDLASLAEYRRFSFDGQVGLGDTVQVENTKIGVWYQLRVAALEYDCIRQRVTNVTVGEIQKDAITEFTKQGAEAQAAAAIDGSSDEEVRIVSKNASGAELVLADAEINAKYTQGSLTQTLKIAVGQIVQQIQSGTNLGQIAATALDGLELMFNRIKWLVLNPRLGVIRAREYASAVQAYGDVEDYTETTIAPTGLKISEYDYNAGTKTDLANITQNSIEFLDANGNYTGTFNGIDLSTLGKKVELTNTGTQATVSVQTGTSWQAGTSFNLPAGIMLVEVVARFDANATGYRAVGLSASSGGAPTNNMYWDTRRAASGSYTFCRFVTILSSANGVTRYVNLVQNSGNALNCVVRYRYTKIGEV